MPLIQEPGRYTATVTAAEFGQSEANGTPFIRLDFDAGDAGQISGWLYLSEKALPYSLRTLRGAFDFDGNFETAIEQFTGRDCSITCEMEPNDKGEDRLRVKWINSPRANIPLEDKDSFLKSLSAKAARIPKEAPKASAPTRPAAAPAKPVAKPAPKPVEKEEEPF